MDIHTIKSGDLDEKLLLEYFWENSTLLPYLKEEQSLRYYKTDYFAVLMAGNIVRLTKRLTI